MGCWMTPTRATTDVSCIVFCDIQYDPVKSHARDIVQAKTHNSKREALRCKPKACQVDIDAIEQVKRSQACLKREIPQDPQRQKDEIGHAVSLLSDIKSKLG